MLELRIYEERNCCSRDSVLGHGAGRWRFSFYRANTVGGFTNLGTIMDCIRQTNSLGTNVWDVRTLINILIFDLFANTMRPRDTSEVWRFDSLPFTVFRMGKEVCGFSLLPFDL